MNPARQARPRWLSRLHAWRWALLAVLLAGILITLVSGYFYWSAREEAQSDLAVVAELKAKEIARWLAYNRTSMVQPPSGYLADTFAEWQQSAPGPQRDAILRGHLAFYLQRYPEANRIALYDRTGHFVLSTDGIAPALPQPLDTRAMPDRRARLFDFYLDDERQPRLAFSSVLSLKVNGENREIGFVLLEIDPQRHFYPFIQTWPSASRSGESVLSRQIGHEIEFLSPLRFGHPPILGMRRAIAGLQISGEQPTRVTRGTDYRGVEVLRVERAVPNSPWTVIAKIDTAEVFAPARRNSLIFSAILLALLATGASLVWQNQRRTQEAAGRAQAAHDMALLRAFIDGVPESLLMLRHDGLIAIANQAAARHLGHAPEELVGKVIWQYLPEEIAKLRQAAIAQALASGKPTEVSDTRNGIELRSTCYPFGDGQHLIIIGIDETLRNADLRARRMANLTLQGFLDHLPGAAYVMDHESRVQIANDGFERMFGIDPASMPGKLSNEIFSGAFGEKLVADNLRILTSGRTEVIEENFAGRFYETTKFVIPREDAPPLLGGMTFDITQRHLAENALRQNEERLRSLSDNLPDSYLFQLCAQADGTRRITYLSAVVERIHGISPQTILNDPAALYSQIHPNQITELTEEQARCRATLATFAMDLQIRRADGQYGWFSVRALPSPQPDGSVVWNGVVTDITAKREAEALLAQKLAAEQALNKRLEAAHNQLLQSEKLAAIGQLAAGVAHELNNPIGFVHSNLGTLREYVAALISLCDEYAKVLDALPTPPRQTEIQRIKQEQDYPALRADIFPLLEESSEGLRRMRKIVQDLRDFSRAGDQEWAPADLHKGLDSTLNIVASELKHRCTIHKEYGELPEVFCVISQLNQVFMNLLVNAAQAIEGHGEITLRSGLEGPDQVWLSISDTGAGIAPEHLNHIFEPFFTTKPVGIGTGLGLSLVFSIIARHHGHIEVSSTPGKGTTFRIVLPIRQPEPTEDALLG